VLFSFTTLFERSTRGDDSSRRSHRRRLFDHRFAEATGLQRF